MVVFLQLRKAFILLNAIIGVLTVFKISGYGYDNFICGLYGLGGTYIEMITGFVRRIFVWFFELLDYKVIPNNPPSSSSWYWGGPKQNTWYDRNMVNDTYGKITDLARNQDFYHGPFNNNSNSSWSWTSILYYGGIALLTLGTLYLGIKIYNEVTNTISPTGLF